MTYSESYALMKDQDFKGRIQVAALKYANSIADEASNVMAHNTRMKWAVGCMQNPDMTAGNLQPAVVMDGQVQIDGKDITDAKLQASVEAVVNKLM